MVIKYNPYNWEIRPNKNQEIVNTADELKQCYHRIWLEISRLYSYLGCSELSVDSIEMHWSEIRWHQAGLNDEIDAAIRLREKLDRLMLMSDD